MEAASLKLKRFSAVLLFVFVSACFAYAADIYDSEPTFSPYYAGSVNRSVLYDALDELNYIRWLIGVPNNVTLNDEYTRKAQHGAVLLDAIDTLTHTPGKPSDMSDTFYQLAYDATTHGNIAVSQMYRGSEKWGNITLSDSTKFYMDDSDEYNISQLGHRRWLMNPRMKHVGFGISTRRGYAVTYVIEEFDSSTQVLSPEEYERYLEWLKWPVSDEFITWPTNQHPHPLEYFAEGTAWSVTLNRDVFDTCTASSVNVMLTRQSDGSTWNFGSYGGDGYFNVTDNGVAYDQCIIFRPDGVGSYNNGETWRVDVSGLTRKDGSSAHLTYIVQFTGDNTYDNVNTDDNSDTDDYANTNDYADNNDYAKTDDYVNNNDYADNNDNNNNNSGGGSGGCALGFWALSAMLVVFVFGIPRRKIRAGR